MKKIAILSICAMAAMGAMAQEAVVKDAERAMKKDAPFTQVVQIITPAISDPVTSKQAQTYYIPGKAGFNQYDRLIADEALGRLDDAGKKTKVEALLGGYEYFMKALPFDSVPDEKGNVKPKYSKEIVNVISGHYNDFNGAAVEFWNFGAYDKAYEAWDIYTTLPEKPAFAKAIGALIPADTLMAEILYNKALAAWQMDDLNLALKAFLDAKSKGYNKKNLYDFAIAVASGANDQEALVALAKEANELYGQEDTNYIGYIINDFIQKGEYNQAVNMIDQAIAANPTNAQYYVIKGILFEQDGVDGDSKAQYQKAVDVDPYNAQALYNLGRMYYNEALEIYNAAPTDQEAFSKVFVTEFKPVMLKAVNLFEQSYGIDEENRENLKLLEQAYYMLNDEANLKATQDRLAQ